ncbi:hypothetical protein [Guyparkeria sp.]|uniref:hypothetical protein n=1 Tax=Guyparkeria sp. TaxID=2035736 RepID=UPI003970DC42
MFRQSLLAIALSGGVVPTLAADDRFPADRLATIAGQLQHFGFTHVTEIAAESRQRATVEGWRDPDWHSELTWSLATGQGLEEELEYGITTPWGITPADIPPLVAWMTGNDTLTHIDSLEIEHDGEVELEGENATGESVAWRTRLEAFRAQR